MRIEPLSCALGAELVGVKLRAFMRWFRTHFGCTATAWRLAN